MDSCHHCPKHASCSEICPEVEAQLPKPWSGEFRVGRNGDAHADMLRALERRVYVQALVSARDVLTANQRRTFDLYYNEGMSHTAIAQALGTTRNAVTETLHRARLRIEESLLHTPQLAEPEEGLENENGGGGR